MNTVASQRYTPLIIGCLAATWIIWGSTYLAIKFALLSFPPYWQMGTRFIVAGVGLLAWMYWRKAPMPTPRQWRNALIIGFLLLVGGMGNTAYAEQTIASGLVVAFIAVLPAMIALLNLPFGIRPSRLEVLGIAIGIVGVLMLTQGSGFSASPRGLLAITTACFSWSLGSVLSQQRFPLAPGAVGFASEMICGGVLLMVLAWASGESPQWPPQPLAAWSWAYLVVFGSLIAFNAYMVLLAQARPALASSYSFVNPVIAMLLGIFLAGEVVSGFEWLSTGVIVIGVIVIVLSHR